MSSAKLNNLIARLYVVKKENPIESPKKEIAGNRHRGQKIVKFPKIKPEVPAIDDKPRR